jgi:hypothetical protein
LSSKLAEARSALFCHPPEERLRLRRLCRVQAWLSRKSGSVSVPAQQGAMSRPACRSAAGSRRQAAASA